MFMDPNYGTSNISLLNVFSLLLNTLFTMEDPLLQKIFDI